MDKRSGKAAFLGAIFGALIDERAKQGKVQPGQESFISPEKDFRLGKHAICIIRVCAGEERWQAMSAKIFFR